MGVRFSAMVTLSVRAFTCGDGEGRGRLFEFGGPRWERR
jgi:hypothetical protein